MYILNNLKYEMIQSFSKHMLLLKIKTLLWKDFAYTLVFPSQLCV